MNLSDPHVLKGLQGKENLGYPVMEYFYSLQGEGFNTGRASFFIRLGGCDVGCHWCDVKESWDANAHPLMSVRDLIQKALENPGRTIVITGGEPCMYDLNLITREFKRSGFNLWLETSGAYEIKGEFDWICLSPKKTKAPIDSALQMADELKVIIYNQDDFRWAETFKGKLKPGCTLYLQPEWSKKDKMLPSIIKYIGEHPEWSLSLQTHKYLDIR